MSMSEEVSNKLVRASEWYGKHTGLRMMVAGIPNIGSSLDILFYSKGEKFRQRRVAQLLKYLKTEMKRTHENMVDKKYLKSEECFDLFLKAIDSATKTRHSEKIHLYAKVLRGAVIIQDRQEFLPEEYLDILSELSPREIEVARAIYEQQFDGPQDDENELGWAERKGWAQLSEQCPSIPKEDLVFILQRLARSGLIREVTGMYWDYGGGVYVITDVFRKLMRYLEKVE